MECEREGRWQRGCLGRWRLVLENIEGSRWGGFHNTFSLMRLRGRCLDLSSYLCAVGAGSLLGLCLCGLGKHALWRLLSISVCLRGRGLGSGAAGVVLGAALDVRQRDGGDDGALRSRPGSGALAQVRGAIGGCHDWKRRVVGLKTWDRPWRKGTLLGYGRGEPEPAAKGKRRYSELVLPLCAPGTAGLRCGDTLGKKKKKEWTRARDGPGDATRRKEKRRWVSGGFADGDARSGLGALAKRLTGWVWVEVFGGDRGRQAKLCKARCCAGFPRIFFFAWAFPAESQPGPPRHQHCTNRGGCHCQPDTGRVIVGCGYRPGAAATETDTHPQVCP